MKILSMALSLLAYAAPVWAAELAGNYETMGILRADIGGTAYDMVIPWDTESDSGYIEHKMIAGSYLTINTVGVVVDETGNPGRPMLQSILQEHGERCS